MARGGPRPNSGRRKASYELNVLRIINDSMPDILIESAKCVLDFFKSETVSITAKAELGCKFLVKAMPQNVNIEGANHPIFQLIVSKMNTPENNRLVENSENAIHP